MVELLIATRFSKVRCCDGAYNRFNIGHLTSANTCIVVANLHSSLNDLSLGIACPKIRRISVAVHEDILSSYRQRKP